MLPVDHSDHQPPRFIVTASGDLHKRHIEPQPLYLHEVDTVFELVGRALGLIELEARPLMTSEP